MANGVPINEADALDQAAANMDPATDDFWNSYDAAVAEESGGNIVGHTTISLAFKVYASGYTGNRQGETFFPCGIDEASKQAAKARASAFKRATSTTTRIGFGILIATRKDGAFSGGKQATWESDTYYQFYESWTAGAKDVVVPALRKLGIVLSRPVAGWMMLTTAEDPHIDPDTGQKKMKVGRDGKERPARVTYPLKKYASQEAAYADLDGGDFELGEGGEVAEAAMPGLDAAMQAAGYDRTTWSEMVGEMRTIYASYGPSRADEAVEAIVNELGLPEANIRAALELPVAPVAGE